MAGASLLAEAVANALPARGPGVPAWPFFIRVHQSNQWLIPLSAFLLESKTFCHSQECWSKFEGVEGPASRVEWADGKRFTVFDFRCANGRGLRCGRCEKTRYSLPVTRHGLLCSSFFAVDLRPDGEHDVAEEEGVEGDQRDVAAEVEGEDDADEEEEHAAGFLAFEVLAR
jgi:hypothetical protein